MAILLAGCTTFWTGDITPVPAPEFATLDVDGQMRNRTDFDGPVLLDFMGTWCIPCQRAVPVLRDLQAAYPDLTVISISSTDTAAQVQDFRAQHGATWPHIVDPGGDAIVEPYREAGSSAPHMTWPSYALIIDGELVFYNRGETLPATFAAALDRHVTRQAPAVAADAAWPILLSFSLGAAAWLSPWLLPIVAESPRRRPAASVVLPVALFSALALAASYGSRPLSGRVATVAPVLAAAGVFAVVYWRWRGDVAAGGKRLEQSGWSHAWALHGNLLWYAAPVWGAVLHAALLRTAPLESLLMVAAFGVGVAACDAVVQGGWRPTGRAAWLGATALLVGALWNALLYIR